MRPLLLLATLLTALALAGCSTTSGDEDSDGDGVPDDVERNGRDISVTTLDGVVTRHVTSEVGEKDTDGDGLGDLDELVARGSDPRDVDTDGDGLLDGHDVPVGDARDAAAWRARGILERDGRFLGELDACPPGFPPLKAAMASSDLPTSDGLGDGEELRGWNITVRGVARAVTSDPCTPDGDSDGLEDHDEKRLGTDPRDPDTDGDGVRDGQDADPLRDLAVRFEVVSLTRADGSDAAVRLVFAGPDQGELTHAPDGGPAVVAAVDLDVPDQTADRRTLEVSFTVAARDAASNETLALFDDPRGAIFAIDVLGDPQGGTLDFGGADGTLRLRWQPTGR